MEGPGREMWLCVVLLMSNVVTIRSANLTSIADIIANMRAPQGPQPVVVKMPSPPPLKGPLASNDYLTRAQTYALNLVQGPESMVVVNRYIYTGLADGHIVEIRPNGSVRKILRMSQRNCGQPNAPEGACGRPMGIRADSQGYLVVADAYNGIFQVHPVTGQHWQLVDARNLLVNKKPLGYINDLAVARDGTIFFTSSSNKWKPSQSLNIIFEGETSGRVLVYRPREMMAARRVQELVANLHYPNGLELGPNDQYLLIGEGGRSRIYRAWIGRNTPKYGKIETFATNLPGFVDNIRRTPRNTYWVGLSRARHAELPSVLDTYGDKPQVRANLINMVKSNMIFDDPNFGIVVELSETGSILRSLQDPTGSVYTSVSEIEEENDLLFLASPGKNFVGILDLKALPKPTTLPKDVIGSGNHVINIDAIEDPNMKAMLVKVKSKLSPLSGDQKMAVALLFSKRLYEVSLDYKKLQDEMTQLRDNLQALQENIGQGGSGSGTGAGGGGGSTSAPGGSETTTVVPTETSTAGGAVVVPPDQQGSSGLDGSPDGGAASGVSTSSPGSTAGGTTPSAGQTTQSAAGTTASASGAATPAPGATTVASAATTQAGPSSTT